MTTDTATAADTSTPPTRPSWLRHWATAVAGAVVALLVGIAIGVLLPAMNRPADDSADAGFLRDMSTHHAQAVEMAMIAYGNSTTPDIRTLGSDIALTQHGQINIMQTWLRGWKLNVNGTHPPMSWMPDSEGAVQNGLMPGMATPEQMASLRAARGKALDTQFLQMMRQHHLGGVHMAEAVVKHGGNDQVIELAEGMIASQRGELALMNDLLKRIQSQP